MWIQVLLKTQVSRTHLEEIEVIDIETLTNDEDMFEWNMCIFDSGNENGIKGHLIEHIMVTKVTKMWKVKEEKLKLKSLSTWPVI